ncbi:hypothetical protein, partial [Mycolicibacterium porcinum]|uniref:hypothetical protein n=1 Tax=Mycolicibacterium porcinum TaxID=39693 RepID=UPI0013F4EA5F
AHYALGGQRAPGETKVMVYPGDSDSGPALQIVTEQAAMLVDSAPDRKCVGAQLEAGHFGHSASTPDPAGRPRPRLSEVTRGP